MSVEGQVAKRLQSDLMMLIMNPIKGVSAFPDGDNLLLWKGTVEGNDDGVYAGMEYSLTISFPLNYPMSPPQVRFMTPIFHPNIDMSGNICLDILKENWSASYTVSALLLSIQGLLETPNNSSPLNNQAAQLWGQREEFLRYVKLRYANLPINDVA